MKMLREICFACVLCFGFYGCSKNEEIPEIKIKKKETVISSDSSNETWKEDKVNSSTSGFITSKEVKNHIGDSVRIKGFVADIYLGEKVAYLNFENKFPKNYFSCAVFASRFSEFGDISRFKNKKVEVKGKVTSYKNKPQVILESADQIKITD